MPVAKKTEDEKPMALVEERDKTPEEATETAKMVSDPHPYREPRFDRCGHELLELTDEQLWVLTNNLNPTRIAHRKQGTGNNATNLSYMEAWEIRAELTRVFGFGGWSAEATAEIVRMDHDIPAWEFQSQEDFKARKPKVQKMENGVPVFNWRVTAKASMSLHIHQLGVWYSEVAVASQTGPDVGEVGDFATKTAESDALKRAAMNLGTAFGLSLYDKGSTNDVVKIIFAEGQRDGRKRWIDKMNGEVPTVPDTPENPIVLETYADPNADSGEGEPPSQAADPRPTEAEAPQDPEHAGPIDWASDALKLSSYTEVKALYVRANNATPRAAEKALEVIADYGAKLRAQEEERQPASEREAQASAVDQMASSFKHDDEQAPS